MQKIILHIDMNCYFASVEMAVNPSLKGKPIAIGGDYSRGIISTASYEARKYGVNSAMPTYKAKELCKDLIILPVHFELYEKYTFMFIEIIKRYSKIIEMASIDECYVDMTMALKDNPNPMAVIKSIQYSILNELGLPCSIGVSYCKYLAKMASDMKKPLGITVLKKSNLKDKMWPLDIGNMLFIGKKSAPRLRELGFKTIGDLANCKDEELLKKAFGKNYIEMQNYANGIDESIVNVNNNELKSVGHSRTFDHDTNNYDELVEMIKYLSKLVSKRAIDQYLIGKNVCLTIKYSDFSNITRTIKLKEYTNSYDDIFKTALKTFDSIFDDRMIRLVGVTLQNTIKINEFSHQLSIFDEDEPKFIKNSDTVNETRKLINDLNRKLGSNALITAREIKNR